MFQCAQIHTSGELAGTQCSNVTEDNYCEKCQFYRLHAKMTKYGPQVRCEQLIGGNRCPEVAQNSGFCIKCKIPSAAILNYGCHDC
jgi:hypothetical protein